KHQRRLQHGVVLVGWVRCGPPYSAAVGKPSLNSRIKSLTIRSRSTAAGVDLAYMVRDSCLVVRSGGEARDSRHLCSMAATTRAIATSSRGGARYIEGFNRTIRARLSTR